MNSRSLRPWLVLSSALLLLAGCSREDQPANPAASAPSYLAVARGRIDVEGGLLKLGFTSDAVVNEIKVKEGEQVKKGQLLATLDSELQQLAVGAALTGQQQVQVQAKQLARQLKFAEQKAKRLTLAAGAGAGDQQSADEAHEAVERLRDESETNKVQADIATRKLNAARYELTRRSLRAPIDAEVVRRLIQPGAAVSAQSGAAFVLLPNQPRIVRAELNESFAGVVTPGMQAEVTDDSGTGSAPLSAHVVRISAVLGNSTLEDDAQVRANMRTVECILAFDQPPPASLRVGQRMLVRFGP
ncbi:secretion protein HlyD [Pseudomonas palleroniana]|uniref:Secretion protein HlyD n=1 Tax=Pseudomonas palleroniana TaxID=191390 RepID=A0A2L1JFM6_9PSED|nr:MULTISPECIES: HlyD family efflux transporter periplasmic adaptor subunit [Pseudomonas]AVE07269.1 secretion protein HlyD [Pseudomonas palleroniana]NCE83937.1 HlyD family efflux transporter periplasmic adaptor subunit [Pseudomonas sp. Q1]